MYLQEFVFHLHVTAGGAFQFYQSFYIGIGGFLGKVHFHRVLLKGGFYHAEGTAVVGFIGLLGLFCFAAYGQAEGKRLLGGVVTNLVEGKTYAVGLSCFPGRGGKANCGRIDPLCGAFHLGLEGEQTFGGLRRGILG